MEGQAAKHLVSPRWGSFIRSLPDFYESVYILALFACELAEGRCTYSTQSMLCFTALSKWIMAFFA